MLKAFNLVALQHVSGLNHKNGNTLHPLITRLMMTFLSEVRIRSDVKLCDHYAVHSQVKLKKPPFERKVDIESPRTDIKSSTLLSDYSGMDLIPLVDNFENILTDLLHAQAPIKKRSIILRPHAPWYNNSIDAENKKRRELERRWRKWCLSIDRELYITQCGVVNDII